VGSQVGWTFNRYIYDGNTAASAFLYQIGTTPAVSIYAGSADVGNVAFPTGIRGVLSAVFEGAFSSVRLNDGSAVTGNPGSQAFGGFTLASLGSGGSNLSNITANEIAIYNVAHTAAQQLAFWKYASRKWGVR